jgi:hypothetical protein
MNDKDMKPPKPRPKAVALDASGKVVELDPAPAKPAKPKLVAVSLDASGKVVESASLPPAAPAAKKSAPKQPTKPKPEPKPAPAAAAKPEPPSSAEKPAASAQQESAPADKPAPAKKPFLKWGPVDVRNNSIKELGRFERAPLPKGATRRVEVHLAWHKQPAIGIQGFEDERPFGFFNVRASEVDDLCRMLQEGKRLIEEGKATKQAIQGKHRPADSGAGPSASQGAPASGTAPEEKI